MPLAFRSVNRGVIAFGFFNIESDLLLLDHYFFFAGEFCHYVGTMAEGDDAIPQFNWTIDIIRDHHKIGDLMGAIHGVRHVGFIGDVYRRFPFPRRREDFRQHPDGFKNRKLIRYLLDGYAEKNEITFYVDAQMQQVHLGEFLFTRDAFQELVYYIWYGGAPRWKDGQRPDYVMAMKEKIEQSKNWLFAGMQF